MVHLPIVHIIHNNKIRKTGNFYLTIYFYQVFLEFFFSLLITYMHRLKLFRFVKDAQQ